MVTEAPDHTGYAVAPRVSAHMALLAVQVILGPQKSFGDISNGSFYLDVPHTALGSCGLSGDTARQQDLAPHSSKIHRPPSLPSQQPWRDNALCFLKILHVHKSYSVIPALRNVLRSIKDFRKQNPEIFSHYFSFPPCYIPPLMQ